MQPIIKINDVSKLYRLGEVGTGTISHDINRWLAKIRGKDDPFAKIGAENDRTKKTNDEYVWALKDINFEVAKGDVVGIIGRNGAGKSTLLKILSKTTAPTTGEILVNGRIASLLEVGTGFHPELTGKENIFLNGAILGMRKAEIQKKLEAIVDFAGVAKYLDTPVKRYSSGMYVRLAFAVAAHLEPDILIVDEVLAVGDAEFQKKCLGKMKDVSVNDGRTVLFVSHNIGAIQNLCTKGILLRNGTMDTSGPIESVLSAYLLSGREQSILYEKNESAKSNVFIQRIEIKNNAMTPTQDFSHEDDIYADCNIAINASIPSDCRLLITVQDKHQRKVFSSETYITKAGRYLLKIENSNLTRGNYSLNCIIYTPAIAQYDFIEECCNFSVIDTGSAWSHLESFDYGVTFGKTSWIN